jgi:hypothetical protein
VIYIGVYEEEAALWATAESSPAFPVYRQLELLKQSYSILTGNYGDLIRVLSTWNKRFEPCKNDDELGRALEESSADGVVFPYCSEAMRTLNNCLASATMLTDHIRTCAKRQPDNGALEKQRSEKAHAVFNTGDAQFARAVRNYMQHDGLPLLCAHFEGCADGPREAYTSIDAETLKRCAEISAGARRYIDTHGRYVIIEEFASVYFEACSDYYHWFTGELQGANKKGLDALMPTMARIKRIRSGNQTEEGPSSA